MRKASMIGGLLTLTLFGTACGDDTPSAKDLEKTLKDITGSGLPTAPSTGGSDRKSPFASGTASYEVSGSVTDKQELALDTTNTSWAKSGSISSGAMAWKSDSGIIFGLGGNLGEGDRKTNIDGVSALSLSIAAFSGGKAYSIISTKGECSVKITKSASSGFEGSFECTDVKQGDGSTLSAKGTFFAKA